MCVFPTINSYLSFAVEEVSFSYFNGMPKSVFLGSVGIITFSCLLRFEIDYKKCEMIWFYSVIHHYKGT